MSHGDFENALKSLLDDGLIYTGIDDNQFGVTE